MASQPAAHFGRPALSPACCSSRHEANLNERHPCADGTGLSFAAVQGILAGCIVAVVACLAVTALLVYLCARRAARLRGVRPPVKSKPCPKTPVSLAETALLEGVLQSMCHHKQVTLVLVWLAGKSMTRRATCMRLMHAPPCKAPKVGCNMQFLAGTAYAAVLPAHSHA